MLERTRLRAKFLRFVQQPTRTDFIFDMIELSTRMPENAIAIAQVESRALADERFRRLWEGRWRPAAVTMQELHGMPSGSLGCAYREHLAANRLDPDFFRAPAIRRPIDYVSRRLYETHDLWHVLLGYDVSATGELGVQAFTLAQLGTPASSLLIAGGMLSVLTHEPQSSEELFASMGRAFERGRKSGFVLGLKLEEMLTRPVEEVRVEAGLAP